MVASNGQCLEDVIWWLALEKLLKGAPFSGAPPEQTLFSDASRQGWGAHLGDSLALGVWTTEEQGFHINQLKLLSVFRALQKLRLDLFGSVVFTMSDNSTVVAYLRNSGGYSFRVPIGSCRGSSPVVREPFHLIAFHVHSRTSQFNHGCSQSGRCGFGVDPTLRGVQGSLSGMGFSSSASFRHSYDSSSLSVCVTSSGSGSMETRCVLLPLGRS